MGDTIRSVLITGCSEGGLGASLALEFHKRGLRVFATARCMSKMASLSALGINTLTLDVLSDSSIQQCTRDLSELTNGTLDILVNNAGAVSGMAFSDLDVTKAKDLFDLNVWSHLKVTQSFLPLLLKSRGTIVNHTSVASVLPMPFMGSYHASKAALAMFSEHQRLELAPFGVKVVELKSGSVKSHIFDAFEAGGSSTLQLDPYIPPSRPNIRISCVAPIS